MKKTKDIFEFLERARKAGDSDELIYRKVRYFIEQKARENAIPVRGSFELTPFCNLDCYMCYVHLSEAQMRGRKLLPAETWIDLMSQAIDAGMSSAVLTGGECLTYPEFNKIYLFLKSRGVLVTVKTNGVLLDSERIEFFKNYPPHGLLISLYGHSNDIYEKVTGKRVFFDVVENIQGAKNAYLPISIMITPNSYIGDSVKETIRFAKNLNLPYYINSILMTPRPDTQKEKSQYDITLDRYIDILLFNSYLNNVIPQACETVEKKSGDESKYELRGVRCGAGKSGFSIRWDGNMYPCVSLDSISENPIEKGFYAAWKSINRKVTQFPVFKKCEKCVYSRYCTYCVAENEKLGTKYELNNIWCQRTWKLVESGLSFSYQQCEGGK